VKKDILEAKRHVAGIVNQQQCTDSVLQNVHCGSKKTRQLWRTITATQFSRF